MDSKKLKLEIFRKYFLIERAQMLQALEFMHKHGFFHRDMKPENVLVQTMPKSFSTSAEMSVLIKIVFLNLL